MKDGVADSHPALVGRQQEMVVLWSRFEESTVGRLQVALVASIFSGKGEPDAEGAAFARRTFSSDATTQLFDQGLCDRKS